MTEVDHSSKREAKLSPYSKEAVLKREAEARANSAAEDRCVNTIHSNYVTDHRCQRERGHEGDCWFGRLIPNSAAQGNDLGPDSQAGSSATRKDAGALGRATRNRVRYVHLPAWFAIEEDGRLRLCDEAEAEEARRQLREP